MSLSNNILKKADLRPLVMMALGTFLVT